MELKYLSIKIFKKLFFWIRLVWKESFDLSIRILFNFGSIRKNDILKIILNIFILNNKWVNLLTIGIKNSFGFVLIYFLNGAITKQGFLFWIWINIFFRSVCESKIKNIFKNENLFKGNLISLEPSRWCISIWLFENL